MAASVISISLDVSFESVGSSFPRVIIIGSISVEVPVASEVGASRVASPAGVLELDTHSKISPPPVSVAPMVLPFLCLDDSESDTEIPKRHVSPTPHDAMITRWRSREDIPIGRLYRTHPGGPCRALTARKSVRHFPSYHLALRSPLLSTMYPPTTSESSVGDSFFESSAEPSRKICRFLAATVTSSIHAMRALVPSCADLLLPRKRFRDSISPEDSVEEDIDTDVLEDIEADATVVEVAVDRDVKVEVDTCIDMEVDVRVDVEDEVEDKVKSSNRGTMEVRVDMVAGIDIPRGMLMPDVVEHLE
nr:hypothetical protein [Tanacetum cinerariifolium]